MRSTLGGLVVVVVLLGSAPARADLHEYVKKAEPKYEWKLEKTAKSDAGTVYNLHLVSQEWQKIVWEHDLQVFVAANAKPGKTMILWNQGGKPNIGTAIMGMELSKSAQAPVAMLFGIPNQPLFDSLKEDALIAYTFVQYLKSKDESWPLLFAMVKSLVKAMDALQAFAKQEWKTDVEKFVVSGASKRGWTSWLTAAADPRVKAIAPLVIDTLNMGAQLPYQLKSFGEYSEMIADYTRAKLVPLPDTAEAKKLWMMTDPYSYRKDLKLPKFIINGNSDPYWTTDALNLYWNDLEGDKWILYIPNAGHDLQQVLDDNKKDRTRVGTGLAAFCRHMVKDAPLPKLEWKHDDSEGQMRLVVQCDPAPQGARLWVADGKTRDFRKSKWTEQKATVEKGRVTGLVEVPKEGCRAFYAELDYEIDGIQYHLSTQLRLVEKGLK